ncbi:MAG: molybdopterin-guanine dinucleotide biosynthesis protein B [Planctomycetota bacterium]|nr:MAG: molybdopterin-guanine dinucleotide biosynthesis protein B [Planctomycetota bacterium]
MNRVHIVGRKNSGKTTLVVELVAELSSRGLRVGTIKHTHHRHELDAPGKDSFRHREAGAAAVGILSPAMSAVFIPATGTERDENRYREVAGLFANCDLVVVEGDLMTEAPKIEVWRAALGTPPYAAEHSTIRAVVSDDAASIGIPVWPRGDVGFVADRVLEIARA